MFFGPLMLTAAIVSEVIGTLALRASDGFSRPLPTLIVVAGYVLSFIAMAQALKELPLGLVYAVWAGTGTAIIALAGIAMFGEAATMLKMASLALIILGVVGLNLSGAH